MSKTFLILILSLIRVISYSQNDQLNTAYLNQETPSDIPLIFAPDLISKKGSFEYPCSFSTDMKEMYFGVNMFHEEKQERYILQVKRQDIGSIAKRSIFFFELTTCLVLPGSLIY